MAKQKYSFLHSMKTIDQFSQSVQLNYDGGKTHYKSFTGCFLTVILLGSVFFYGAKRYVEMDAKSRVTVQTHTEYN